MVREYDPELMPDEVLYENAAGVARVTINRPERRNAMSFGVMQGLRQAIARARENDEVRVVVLTGAGDKAFCAGADLGSGGIADERSPIVARVGHRRYRPFHRGARFSANAATPSAASSVCEVTVSMPWRYESAASASISSTR